MRPAKFSRICLIAALTAGIAAPAAAQIYTWRDEQGNLTFLRGDDRFKAIADMRVVDVKTGQQVRLGDS